MFVSALAQGQQTPAAPPRRTLKPMVMGRHYAVTSMMPHGTMAAQRILESGGNAFDAAVAGQAVFGCRGTSSERLGQ